MEHDFFAQVPPGVQVGCALTLLQHAISRSDCDRMGTLDEFGELFYQHLRYLQLQEKSNPPEACLALAPLARSVGLRLARTVIGYLQLQYAHLFCCQQMAKSSVKM